MSSRLAMVELSIVFPIKDAPAGTMVTVYQRMGSVGTACPGQTDCNQFVVYVGTDTGPGSSTWFSCVNPMLHFQSATLFLNVPLSNTISLDQSLHQ